MAHQYSRVGFKSSVEVNEVNLSLSYGGVEMLYKATKVGQKNHWPKCSASVGSKLKGNHPAWVTMGQPEVNLN